VDVFITVLFFLHRTTTDYERLSRMCNLRGAAVFALVVDGHFLFLRKSARHDHASIAFASMMELRVMCT